MLEYSFIPATLFLDHLKENLKMSVRDYFVENNTSAVYHIESIAGAIGRAESVSKNSA